METDVDSGSNKNIELASVARYAYVVWLAGQLVGWSAGRRSYSLHSWYTVVRTFANTGWVCCLFGFFHLPCRSGLFWHKSSIAACVSVMDSFRIARPLFIKTCHSWPLISLKWTRKNSSHYFKLLAHLLVCISVCLYACLSVCLSPLLSG